MWYSEIPTSPITHCRDAVWKIYDDPMTSDSVQINPRTGDCLLLPVVSGYAYEDFWIPICVEIGDIKLVRLAQIQARQIPTINEKREFDCSIAHRQPDRKPIAAVCSSSVIGQDTVHQPVIVEVEIVKSRGIGHTRVCNY